MTPNEPGEDAPKRTYRWPWVLAAAVVLFVALAILWMSFAVREVERERGVNPPPAAAK